MCTFVLLAIMPTLLTTGAVLATLLIMALFAPTLSQDEPQDEPSYPEVDWLALEAELDVDAAWTALYEATMGCHRRMRCSRPARRMCTRTYMSESRRYVRRCRPCTRHAIEFVCRGRAGEARGPPPHPGARAGSCTGRAGESRGPPPPPGARAG